MDEEKTEINNGPDCHLRSCENKPQSVFICASLTEKSAPSPLDDVCVCVCVLACMPAYLRVQACVCLSMYRPIYDRCILYASVHVRHFVCMSALVCTSTSLCLIMSVYIGVCLCLCVCVCVCMCKFICVRLFVYLSVYLYLIIVFCLSIGLCLCVSLNNQSIFVLLPEKTTADTAATEVIKTRVRSLLSRTKVGMVNYGRISQF